MLITVPMRARLALLGVLALGAPAISTAQKTYTNTIDAKPMSLTDKPFTAERVTRSVTHSESGNKETVQRVEYISRDSSGRIRFELRRTTDDVAAKPETEAIKTANEELPLQILIFDRAKGRTISIQPGMHVAWVKETGDNGDSLEQPRPFSAHFDGLLGMRPPPGVMFEDLGTRNIVGIEARGIKGTNLGREKDGEWQGRPILETEVWVSDDLAITLLKIVRNCKTNGENETSILNLKQEEPEPSLFEIPAGYTINPDTMPQPGWLTGSDKADRKAPASPPPSPGTANQD